MLVSPSSPFFQVDSCRRKETIHFSGCQASSPVTTDVVMFLACFKEYDGGNISKKLSKSSGNLWCAGELLLRVRDSGLENRACATL